MGRKIGMGAGSASAIGRKIHRFKTEFANASWTEIGQRFGVHPDHARVHYKVAEEFTSATIDRVGVNKLKGILDGKVPRNHRRAFLSIATMAEWTELRRLIHRLYGDPRLREQIDEFGCIVCGKTIPFERMSTMQCAKCDGKEDFSVVIRFQGKVEFRVDAPNDHRSLKKKHAAICDGIVDRMVTKKELRGDRCPA